MAWYQASEIIFLYVIIMLHSWNFGDIDCRIWTTYYGLLWVWRSTIELWQSCFLWANKDLERDLSHCQRVPRQYWVCQLGWNSLHWGCKSVRLITNTHWKILRSTLLRQNAFPSESQVLKIKYSYYYNHLILFFHCALTSVSNCKPFLRSGIFSDQKLKCSKYWVHFIKWHALHNFNKKFIA